MTHFTPNEYAKAWEFATHYHGAQSYGGRREGMTVPYVNHVGSVAMEVIAALQTCSEDTINGDVAVQCALLHDVIEDTEATFELVQEHFGDVVASGVQALSKDPTLAAKSEQMADSLRRIQAQTKEVWMVKMADRISNLNHPPFYWDAAKVAAYRVEAATIHQALHTANDALANRLQRKIDEYGGDIDKLRSRKPWFLAQAPST